MEILKSNQTVRAVSHAMTTQQKGLLDSLRAAGWELASTEELHEWWADDVWLMRSVWSPQEAQFYLTFLVDPQTDLHRQRERGESVWAAKASATLPTGWQNSDGEFTFSLGQGWAERLNGLVLDVSRFRNIKRRNNALQRKEIGWLR